jgi:UDP-N-acetyl-D-mannosaminuronate dehydrogenase
VRRGDLSKQKVLVIGLGEVGRALFELLKESGKFTVFGLDTDSSRMREAGQNRSRLPSKVDVMHICLPCNDQTGFISTVAGYAKKFNPKLIIINSTVLPGTTFKVLTKCATLVAHSPIRGVHKNLEHMKWELKRWTKYVGGANAASARAAAEHFRKIGLKIKVLRSSMETELAKLFETTYRAWMITCFQEMHRISSCFNARFIDIVDFIEDTHRVRFDRPLMFPGVIGGHCIIPNTQLLLESYDSEMLRYILKSNEERKKEMKNKKVREETENVKKILENESPLCTDSGS